MKASRENECIPIKRNKGKKGKKSFQFLSGRKYVKVSLIEKGRQGNDSGEKRKGKKRESEIMKNWEERERKRKRKGWREREREKEKKKEKERERVGNSDKLTDGQKTKCKYRHIYFDVLPQNRQECNEENR